MTTLAAVGLDAAEVWRPIQGTNYAVSSLGRVRHGARCFNGSIHTSTVVSKGRRYVTLRRGDRRWTPPLAWLVLVTFLGPCPPQHKLVFLDGDGHNAALSNLAWRPLSTPKPTRRVQHRAPRVEVPERPPAAFDRGLVTRPDRCPRCDGPVEQEPAFVRCRMCGHLWPVRGAPLAVQLGYEAASGLRAKPMPVLLERVNRGFGSPL